MGENRVNGLALAATALAYIAIAWYLEAAGGPQRPDKVLWLDVQTGTIRQAQSGAPGAPWQGPLPAPVRACGIHTEGQWDQPGSPWYCPEGQSGVDNPWFVASPPPLDPCRADDFNVKRNGYLCTRGATYYPSGAGYYWHPERRQ